MVDSTFPNGKPDWERLINPTDKQRAFITEFFQKDYTLYGGAAGREYPWMLCRLAAYAIPGRCRERLRRG